jgi:pyruvate dehydrogenase E2 component (dihydrolipoamide acetyltransferase)
VLKEIKVEVDETVDVGTVVAIIGDAAEGDGGGDAEAEADAGGEQDADDRAGGDAEAAGSVEEREETAEETGADDEDDSDAQATEERPKSEGNGERGDGVLMSPLVRRMVEENDLDPSQISGSGEGGRITREDVESALSGDKGKAPAKEEKAESKPSKAPQPQRRAPLKAGDRERMEDLSRIRQRIAAKMMESMQSSAQLTTVQEADMTRIMRLRGEHKDEFKSREGVSLSPFVFLARAAVLAVRNHPHVNAQADWDAGKVKFHDYVNLGIAVDTEKGLLVPNVKGADDLTLAGLARAIQDAADKARGKGKLEMQDIEGGTFTVTNTGSRGVLLDTPILNYPEVAILATGAIQKRPVVVEDPDTGPSIAIRDMVYLCLTYDHRLIDGADAARFVTEVSQVVETHDWAGELGYGSD